MKYSLDQKISVLSRELKLRRQVYPRQVERGRMREDKAQLEIGVMESILADYQKVQDRMNQLPGMEGGRP